MSDTVAGPGSGSPSRQPGHDLHLGPGELNTHYRHRVRPESRRVIVQPVRARNALIGAAGLFVCTGGLSTYVSLHHLSAGNGWMSPIYLYPFACVAAVGCGALAWSLSSGRGRRWWRGAPLSLYAVGGYVVWAMLSATWSVSPLTTPTVAVVGVGIAAFGYWFGWSLSFAEQVWGVALSMSVAVVLSVVLAVFVPSEGRMAARGTSPGGEWQGIFGNRNSLSPVCVLAIIGLVGLVGLRRDLRTLCCCLPVGVVALVALRESGGLTSTLALALVASTALALPLLWRLRRRGVPGPPVAGALFAAAVAAWALVFANLDALAVRVGRDGTLSHRRWIWQDVRGFIAERPWRGYGFWAFWDRPDLTAATYARHGDAYGSAHNSVLEVLLGLGIVGLVLYLMIGCFAIVGIGRWTWRSVSLASVWWAMVLAFVVAENLMESFVLWHSYQWVLFVAAAAVPFRSVATLQGEGGRPADLHRSRPSLELSSSESPSNLHADLVR